MAKHLPEIRSVDSILPVCIIYSEGPMNHLDNDWTESTLWERWRIFFILVFVLIAMIIAAAVFLGPDGVLRMIGLMDDAYRSRLTVQIEPADATVQLDFKTMELPLDTAIEWDRSTDHVLQAEHPAYRTEKIVFSVPENPESLPVYKGAAGAGRITITPDGISVRIDMIPEYIPLEIDTRPSGAEIMIDGADIDRTTPLTYELETGATVTIRATKEGYEPLETTYTVPDTSPGVPVVFELEAIPTPKQPEGRLVLSSPYPVDVYSGRTLIISGKKAATVRLKAGRHSIRVRNDTYMKDETQTIRIRDGATVRIVPEPLGKMRVESSPSGAVVSVEGKKLGTTPGTFPVSPGLYNVTFTWDQCEDTQSRWVKIVSGQTRRVPRVTGCR